MNKEKYSNQTLHEFMKTQEERIAGQSIAEIFKMAGDTAGRRREVTKEHFKHRIGIL
jgi:hypothetical protein